MRGIGRRTSEVGSRNATSNGKPLRTALHLLFPTSDLRPPTSVLLLILPLLTTVAQAQSPTPPKITGVRIGFDGHYKVGYWTPLEVTLHGGSEDLAGQVEVSVPDGDGVTTVVTTPPSRPVPLSANRDAQARLYVKIGKIDYEMEVVYRVAGRTVARRTFSAGADLPLSGVMSSEKHLIVTVGRPVGIETKGDTTPEGEKLTEVARLQTIGELPTRWYGYEGIDALVLATSDPAIYRELQGNVRAAALEEWVRLGGRLLISAGKNAPEIFAPGAPLAPFAPGRLEGSVPLRQTSAIESYAETNDRLDPAADADGEFRLSVPRFAEVRGVIEAYVGSDPRELPLVVRTPYAFGEVVYVGLDLDQPPLQTWSARQQLFNKLLARKRVAAEKSEAASGLGRVTTLGYDDLAGQLRAALDQFAGVKPVAFWFVALAIVLYIVCIGPLDYLFVKRVLKRVELTWVTFPAIVLLFSLGAYVLAYQLKGDQLRLNQVDVVDFDLESSLVRGTIWANFFSPRIDSYNLSLAPQVGGPQDAPSEILLSWMGLPGGGFGGMSGTGGPGLLGSEYRFSPNLNELEGVPVAVWSTKGVTARWHRKIMTPLEADLADTGERLLAGTITSNLDMPLTDCVLLYDRWAYPVGKLDAGSEIIVEKQLEQQTAETYFKHAGLDEGLTSGPYERDSLDVVRIVSAMMSHEAVGGKAFTNLANQYQRFIDLSNHLACGRAILIGQAESRGADLLRDGRKVDGTQDRHWTFYRFVLPVAERKTLQ